MTLRDKRAKFKSQGAKNRILRRSIFHTVRKITSSVVLLDVLFFNVIPIGMIENNNKQQEDTVVVAPRVVADFGSSGLLTVKLSDNQINPGDSTDDVAQAKALQDQQAAAAKVAAAAVRETVAREYRVYATTPDPSDFDQIYVNAANAYGVDANILKAIHTVETGASGSTNVKNPSGATGPMQFLPSTWRRYGVDGNGDGRADIQNVEDSIFTASRYLKSCGYPDIKAALWGYNPSTSYYNKVMSIARSFGFQQ